MGLRDGEVSVFGSQGELEAKRGSESGQQILTLLFLPPSYSLSVGSKVNKVKLAEIFP